MGDIQADKTSEDQGEIRSRVGKNIVVNVLKVADMARIFGDEPREGTVGLGLACDGYALPQLRKQDCIPSPAHREAGCNFSFVEMVRGC